MKSIVRGCLVALIAVAAFAGCGGSATPAGSSISADITTPAATSDVAVDSPMVVTITDPDDIGITEPADWGSVFTLRAVGSDTNLCEGFITYDAVSTPQTVTCRPATLAGMTEYIVSMSGLTDANGARIDPSALTFTTGPI